ncbi:MAG: UDP-N-acetylmuramoyl-L-alanyl-D-glutamate--2,6-diaminopimelate ligase [Acidimicrobiia bacterium]|nr:UDP-N-acetylmuramoyl-L-alanyl-D-glutamate--2,6-diaminopimelate ligase [Acidimicrobiia bacterium]MXZ87137.1 UDP-N-acetylmuramoyl-L-alanyl-D-glutamate--2,6-diaminopimelate ligase [Acidimicrobiia bacterium]MYB75368.1 UDP-N-acetylmuramoyl-L-alanyl-D-glutamate--2,6-diaminopimelate ligase [Acidimicrobiia bacterium]MYG73563.1 UDP-N-acetylmuramoyl-L-alanyl-D-glutamate--2,6-diaminopimelate ligase [Acidimicrobiia bacterium]MYI00965.1 UDP-N-acetylmuramoyl-L-alanyl-D-glutamate--2,6-diaminopimelate ligas
MALPKLAESAPGLVDRQGDAEITGLAHDSRTVNPGDLFFCVPGANHDGHDFASEAVDRGAAGLVVERPLSLSCPQVQVDSVRRAMGPMSSTFHGHPSRSMAMVGVTGTNGKTTVCSLLGSVLAAAGLQTQVLGTLTGTRTTPESLDVQHQLAGWRSDGVEAVAMEVSSHALHQHRVDGIRYDAAVFTNFSTDHLDYHGTDEEYFEAKARLFTPELSDRAVVNCGDEHGRRLMADSRIPTTGYDPADLPVEVGPHGLSMQWRDQDVALSLIGRFNAANALAAAEAALLLGVSVPDVVAGLESAAPVPGRFETIESDRPFTVVVDYAHTPDGLAKVLGAARELVANPGRLWVVFGCGGDRDASKRPMMGRVAAEEADQVIVTSDNPRSEDPDAIIADILAGVPRRAKGIMSMADRAAAIARSLAEADQGDVIVLAGKGHETTQTVGDQVIPFDDREVARELLAAMETAR